jgi:uncharacterized BrkB/YihY/UPF0761 family membrane protein
MAAVASVAFPIYLVNLSTIGEFGRTVSFVLVALIWFYTLALAILAGAVINALRYELHDTGKLRGMTSDFPATEPVPLPRRDPESGPAPEPGARSHPESRAESRAHSPVRTPEP